MISSMTTFARSSIEKDWGEATWELRSVNHRYLEVSIRLPESLRDLEPSIREKITAQIKRGKVECMLRYQTGNKRGLSINQEVIAQLAQTANSVKALWPEINSPDLMQVLNWPEVLHKSESNNEVINKDIVALFEHTLKEAVLMRAREGKALQQFIEEHLKNMEIQMEKIRERVPIVLKQQHNKIMERVSEFKLELNPERVEQEWLLLAQKMDITEELDRLQTHIKEMRRTLTTGGVIGRRLDFLTQEFLREVNTLCSKSSDSEIAHAGVELKVLIEQIREQAQNIE
jgi:uncharacterized protein (TIGR00255 family)